jgi:hypothetical protein
VQTVLDGPPSPAEQKGRDISGHQRPALRYVVLTVRWDCLMTSAPGRPSQSRAARQSRNRLRAILTPRRRRAGSGANEQAAPSGPLADRLSAFGYPPCVTRMIVLPGTRGSGANADGTSASGRTAPTIGFSRPDRNPLGEVREPEPVWLDRPPGGVARHRFGDHCNPNRRSHTGADVPGHPADALELTAVIGRGWLDQIVPARLPETAHAEC